MDRVHVIRHKVLVEGQSQRVVADQLGVSRNTVRKYVTVPAAPSTLDEAELLGERQEVELTVGVFDWTHNDFCGGGHGRAYRRALAVVRSRPLDRGRLWAVGDLEPSG